MTSSQEVKTLWSQSNDVQFDFEEVQLTTQDNVPCSAVSPLEWENTETEALLPSFKSTFSTRHIALLAMVLLLVWHLKIWFSNEIIDKTRRWLILRKQFKSQQKWKVEE